MLAKHLAALVSLFVTIKVVAAVFAEGVAEVRARRRRNHAVVCGLGETGLRSVRALRGAGTRVTCLDPDATNDAASDAHEAGALVLRRDATHVAALQAARVERAACVVCAAPDDATNTRIASLAAALVHAPTRNRAPSIHVHLDDAELAQLLRAPLATVGSTRLHFFNVAGVWARAILDANAGPFAHLDEIPPGIAIFGDTSLGLSLLVGAARRWHRHASSMGIESPLTTTLVGPGAADACANAAMRYPAIGRVCRLVPIEHALSPTIRLDVDAILRACGPLDAVYACIDDPSANLALALEAGRRLGAATPVLLPATAAAAALGPLLLGVGRVRPVVLPEGDGSLELLHDHMRESLARAVHAAYLTDRAGKADFGTRPADHPWDELGESWRTANREHADAMVEQLRAVWYEIDTLYDWDEPAVELDEDAVEAMAELEHSRWYSEKEAQRFRYGEPRDDARRIHDYFLPWPALGDAKREENRKLIRRRPEILRSAGFRLKRDPARDVLACRLHERYVAARRSKGEEGPLAVPWAELTEQERDYNRAAVDHIAVQLARIGCRAAPSIVGGRPAVFTEDEVARMAVLEHERWMGQRLAAGWRQGPRNDEERTHPSLVPWEKLPEPERDKDRESVREIPELLASIGYTVIGGGAGAVSRPGSTATARRRRSRLLPR